MLAPRFDAAVGSTCVSKSFGSVLISGNGTIVSCSICLSTSSCCSGKSGASDSPSNTGMLPLLLNRVYLVDVLVPLVGLLVHLFHVFLIVRFSESDPNVV